jgi:hypothetical protein
MLFMLGKWWCSANGFAWQMVGLFGEERWRDEQLSNPY